LIFNAFDDPDKRYFRRLFVPENGGEIAAINITDEFQLYCLVQNKYFYTLYTANLDDFEQGTKDFSN